jgi:hypothetical protein
MATKAEKVLKTEKMKSTGLNPDVAAVRYVNAGLKDLGLKPVEKMELQKKLIPIVASRISNDRGRTASRAQNVVNREAKARVAKAKSKI